MVNKNIIPYTYISFYPFVIPSGIDVGYSGVLFEQCNYSTFWELQRLSNQVELYPIIYNSPSCNSKITYYPSGENSAAGEVLSTSGLFTYVDYIEFLREKQEEILVYHANDTDVGSTTFRNEFFEQYFGDTPSGVLHNYNHAIDTSISSANFIPVLRQDLLGGEGTLYDIDLREVEFQPIVRPSKTIETEPGILLSYTEPTNNTPIATPPTTVLFNRPIFPAFAKLNGSIIGLNTGENFNLLQYLGIDYGPTGSGNWRLSGDVITSGTKIHIGSGLANAAIIGKRFISSGALRKVNGTEIYLNSVGANTSGVYRIFLSNENVPFQPVPSALFSKYPPENHSPRGFNGAGTWLGGFHYFDNTFWSFNQSGCYLRSPANGRILWIKLLTDIDSAIEVSGWKASFAREEDASNTILAAQFSQTSANSGTLIFNSYDNQLNRLSSTTGTPNFNTNSFLADFTGRMCKFGTDWLVSLIDNLGFPSFSNTGRSILKYDSSFNFIKGYQIPIGTFTNFDIRGLADAFAGGSDMVWCPSGAHLVKTQLIDGLSSIDFIGSGQIVVPASSIVPSNAITFVHDIKYITGKGPDIPNGYWISAERVDGLATQYYLMRLEEISTTGNNSLFEARNIKPARSILRDFIALPFPV